MSKKSGDGIGVIILLILLVILSFVLMAVPIIIISFIVYYAVKIFLYRKKLLEEPEVDQTLFFLTDNEIESINSTKLKVFKVKDLESRTRNELIKYRVKGKSLNISVNKDGTFSKRSNNGKIIQNKIDELSSHLSTISSEVKHLEYRVERLENAHHTRWHKVKDKWDYKIKNLNEYFEKLTGHILAIIAWFLVIFYYIQNKTLESFQSIINLYIALFEYISGKSENIVLFDSSTWVLAVAAILALVFYYLSKYIVNYIDTETLLKLSKKKPIRLTLKNFTNI